MITGLDAGGAELQLAMILRRTRHEADMVTLYNPGPVAEKIRAQGTSVRDLGMKTNTELGALPRLRCPVTAAPLDLASAMPGSTRRPCPRAGSVPRS